MSHHQSSSSSTLRAALTNAHPCLATTASDSFRAVLSSSPTSTLECTAVAPPPVPRSGGNFADNGSTASSFIDCVHSDIGGGESSGDLNCSKGGTQPACPVFVDSPEVVARICMGAVKGGVKFYTLGADSAPTLPM